MPIDIKYSDLNFAKDNLVYVTKKLTLMAQSVVCLTGDQVMSSIPTRSAKMIMKYFLLSFSFFCWFKNGSCKFLVKEWAQVLVNHLEDKACSGKV